jgi:hypothetical protein
MTAIAGHVVGTSGAAGRRTGDCRPAIRLAVVVPPARSGVDRSGVSSDNPAMDPVIAALAQLVRDRYDCERAEKAAKRQRLRVVEGKSA